jgi:hypothetical protein
MAKLLLALMVARPAGATLYQVAFNDGRGNSGAGEISVQCGNSCAYAASGTLTVLSGQAAGCWSLYTGGGSSAYPGYMTSPAGAYWYNNAVYLCNNNPEYAGSGSLLDLYGLLFVQSNGNELNLWGNADGSYTLGGNIGGWQNFNVIISFASSSASGQMSGVNITPVPEPLPIIAASLLAFPVGVSVLQSWRLRRRSRAAQALTARAI